MDVYDKEILNIIQSSFPLDSRPYAIIGEQIGLSEDETLKRVNTLRETGVIRRLGGNFGSRELGWRSTLCAAQVPEDKLDCFISEVNQYPGVTHNYLRENEFNIWFTLIAPDLESVEKTLASISQATGIKILNLPADKMFKIKVDFKIETEKADS